MTLDSFDRQGLTFSVHDEGPPDGDVVVALHGFPQTAAMWSAISPALVDAGYRVVAPDQRGYSPGARPPGIRAYAQKELVADVAELIDQLGVSRVHLLGHDWGGAIAWAYAAAHPERLHTLSVLSTPHPGAYRSQLFGSQALRSWYFLAFQPPGVPERLLRVRGGTLLRRALTASDMDTLALNQAIDLLADPSAATAAVNWYRALRFGGPRAGRITTPTLFLWGERDRFLARAPAMATGRFVDAPYRFEALESGTHWLAEQAPGLVTDAVLGQLRSVR